MKIDILAIGAHPANIDARANIGSNEALDFLKPRGESKQFREHEIFDALDEQALL